MTDDVPHQMAIHHALDTASNKGSINKWLCLTLRRHSQGCNCVRCFPFPLYLYPNPSPVSHASSRLDATSAHWSSWAQQSALSRTQDLSVETLR